jgi:ComF family protein
MELVLRVKHESGAALGMTLGEMLAERAIEQLGNEAVDLVVPLPMHWFRRLRRGSNPPDLVAEPIASRLHAPLARRALRFLRAIRRQSSLRPAERKINVRDSLAATRSWNLSGAKVLLVDDVMTTGATCVEATRVLRAAGAAKVWATVIARGIGA